MTNIPYLTLFALLAPLALAAPPASEVARAELALQILERAHQEGKDVAPLARQLFLGQDDYAPWEMPCPSDYTWIRSANGLSPSESAWREKRQPRVALGIQKMMSAAGLPQPPRTPVLAYALSGGGLRAMQVGLGGVMATMNASAESAGSGTGGWSDAITYMAGLSGGSWGTATFIANGGRLPTDMIDNLWNLESNIVIPDDDRISFYYNLVSNVRAKSDDFPTQITDYWGLAIADHINPSQYRIATSPNFTMSNWTNFIPALNDADLPLPIIVAAEREPGETVIPANATTWEFTPFEFGAWAFGNNTKVRGAFTPLEYLGSSLNNGQPNGTCWKGFDQVSFITGTSATLFTSAITSLNTANASSIIVDAIRPIANAIGDQENDIAQVPNPFRGYNADTNPISDFNTITLVDAGLTNQNIPIEPLLIPSRGVDAILAFDSSADTTYSWPNGSALSTTYDRSLALAQQQDVSIRMPSVPSTNGFVNGGWNTRPTFFGCGDNETDTTLIVYVPNYPWSDYANKSTFQLSYERDESTRVVLNGLRSLSLNASVATWPKCLACALSDRSFSYTSANRSSECQSCFNTWCWNYQDNTTRPSTEYEPVVGTVPAFLTQNNLVRQGATDAPSVPGGASGSSAATVSSAAASSSAARSGAEKRWSASSGAFGAGLTGVISLGAVFGALAVLA